MFVSQGVSRFGDISAPPGCRGSGLHPEYCVHQLLPARIGVDLNLVLVVAATAMIILMIVSV